MRFSNALQLEFSCRVLPQRSRYFSFAHEGRKSRRPIKLSSLVSLVIAMVQTKSAFNHYAHLTTAVTVGVSFLVTQTNYCVPEASREVVLSLQTTLPRADTESDRCCGRKWAGSRDYYRPDVALRSSRYRSDFDLPT